MAWQKLFFYSFVLVAPLTVSSPLRAQETDFTQTPNLVQAGMKKSLEQQIGASQRDYYIPESSLYLLGRDPFRAIVRGRNLFQRKFTLAQGFGPRRLDGIGDIEADAAVGAGLADSCAACHGRPRGAAGFGGDVFTRPDSRDAPHLFGLGIVEMVADEITQDLRQIRHAAISLATSQGISVTKPLMSKGIAYGHLRANPDGSVDTTGVEGVDGDLRVRPFFHHGGTISIREFIVGAFNAEMGLQAADAELIRAAAGERVVTPAGMVLDGAVDAIEAPPAARESDDPDLDGVANEIPTSLVDHLEFYLLNYFKPGLGRQTPETVKGQKLFHDIQCTTCHIQNLMIAKDRRVADVETTYDPERGIFNHLFAVATPLYQEVPGSGSPPMKTPIGGPFVVKNIYADFKRHDLGPSYWERNFNGTLTKEFLTEPLWGVGSTPPYGHDGRSMNLHEVILRHGGEAQQAHDAYADLPRRQQDFVLDFLQSLILFGPPDTASNLDPGDTHAPDFPQYGHGSLTLTGLFNDPADPE